MGPAPPPPPAPIRKDSNLELCSLVLLTIAHAPLTGTPFGTSTGRLGYAPCLVVAEARPGPDAFVRKVEAGRDFATELARAPQRRLGPRVTLVLVDSTDVYFRHGPAELRRRFDETRVSILFGAELHMGVGVAEHKAYYQQRAANLSYYVSGMARYLNTGFVMGVPDALAKLFDAALASPLLHRHRVKLDQLAVSDYVARRGFDALDASLDYNNTIAYTAAHDRWSLSRCALEVPALDPVLVHMPFTASPRVNNTFYRLWELENGHPPPEADYATCLQYEARCQAEPRRTECFNGHPRTICADKHQPVEWRRSRSAERTKVPPPKSSIVTR
jgi:hypothetical protein